MGNSESIDCRIARMLFQYRITPHSTTGVSPAELLMGRRIRSHLDQIRPDLSGHVESKQEAQKKYHDRHSKARTFEINDPVFVKNPGSGPRWLSGHITKIRGPVSYSVTLGDGRIMRKHVDQIRVRTVRVYDSTEGTLDDYLPTTVLPTEDVVHNPLTATAPPLH